MELLLESRLLSIVRRRSAPVACVVSDGPTTEVSRNVNREDGGCLGNPGVSYVIREMWLEVDVAIIS